MARLSDTETSRSQKDHHFASDVWLGSGLRTVHESPSVQVPKYFVPPARSPNFNLNSSHQLPVMFRSSTQNALVTEGLSLMDSITKENSQANSQEYIITN